MRRYDAGYRQMKQVLDSGEIGEPLMAHCVHRNPSVREAYTTEMAAKDTAVHEVDALRWLLGEEFVVGADDPAAQDLAAVRASAGPADLPVRDRLRACGWTSRRS